MIVPKLHYRNWFKTVCYKTCNTVLLFTTIKHNFSGYMYRFHACVLYTGCKRIRGHYIIAYNFRSYIHSIEILYRLKEIFIVKVATMLQLLQLNLILIKITVHTQGVELSHHLIIDFKHKRVAYQAVIYSYHRVNHHLKTN